MPLSTTRKPVPRHLLRSSLLTLIWAFVVAVPLAGQANGDVDVRSAVKVFVAKGTPALLVAYRYDFSGRQVVYIKGLGVVPAHGEFEYLTRQPALQIREAPDGAILADVMLKETVIVASRAPLNYVPPKGEFPPAFRSDTWSSSIPLLERLNTVLRKYFSYMPHDENRVSYIATTFMPLQVEELPPGATAQIALLISFPHDAAAHKYWFRVHSLVHEGRMLSDATRPTSNENIQRAASKFVDQLINEIKAGGQDQR